MKSFDEALSGSESGWTKEEYGYVVELPGQVSVVIEPLLFGQFNIGVYVNQELVADKVPVWPGGTEANARAVEERD